MSTETTEESVQRIGYLTRVLAGEVQLRVSFVLELCRRSSTFLRFLLQGSFPHSPLSQRNTHLLRGLGALHPQTAPYASIDVLSEATLEIRDAAEKIERYLHSLPPEVLQNTRHQAVSSSQGPRLASSYEVLPRSYEGLPRG